MRQAPSHLLDIIRNVVEPMGYELVGAEYHPQAQRGLLRVYIDQPAGIQLDDCQRVSHQLSGVLDVEDPIAEDYVLEVSSPGLDRPLFELTHFARFGGHLAKVKLALPRHGRRNFKGVIAGVEGDRVLLEFEGETLALAFDEIDSARLVPEF